MTLRHASLQTVCRPLVEERREVAPGVNRLPIEPPAVPET